MDGFAGAVFEGFHTFAEATNFVAENTLIGLGDAPQSSDEVRNCRLGQGRARSANKAEADPFERLDPLWKPIALPPDATTRVKLAEERPPNKTTCSKTNLSPCITPPTSPSRPRSSPSSTRRFAIPPLSNSSPEQKEILSLISTRQNVFFTGAAGTGKTTLVHQIRHLLKSQGYTEQTDFFVAASTGIVPCCHRLWRNLLILGVAGYHIGGMTLHYFAGCGLAEDGVLNLQMKLVPRARKWWEECKVLVIDEISMVNPHPTQPIIISCLIHCSC